MVRFIKSLPCALVFLAACSLEKQNTASPKMESQLLAAGAPSDASRSLLLCDSLTAESADKLNRYALGSFKNGVITKAEADSLQKVSGNLLACFSEGLKISGISLATAELQIVKQQANVGVATRQMVLHAGQKLIDATFCENSLSKIKEIESILQKEAEVGVRSIADFISVLKKRLLLKSVCASS